MKQKPICFVDFGLEHITLIVCFIEENRVVDIPFIETEEIKLPVQRIQSPLNQMENFDTFIKLVDKAEKQLKISISSVVFVLKDKSFKHFLMRSEKEFKTIQKVSNLTMEKLAKQTIANFCEKNIEEYNILDFVKHNFQLDKAQTFINPYKIKCKKIEIRASIFAIRKIFTKLFGEYLEKYKIHIKHYISSTTGLFSIADDYLLNGNILLIDIGSCSTEFFVINRGVILFADTINLGGLDMTRDIADVMKLYIGDADLLKKRLKNKFGIVDNTSEIEKNNQIATTIADVRLKEIANCIGKEVNNKIKKIAFNKVIISGGVSKYKNTKQIFEEQFSAPVENISKKVVLENRFFKGKIDEDKITSSNLSLFGAISFYLSNQEIYKNAKHGFIFSVGSKISCFLRDLLY